MSVDINRDAELRLKINDLVARVDDLQRRIAEVVAQQRQLADDFARARRGGLTTPGIDRLQ